VKNKGEGTRSKVRAIFNFELLVGGMDKLVCPWMLIFEFKRKGKDIETILNSKPVRLANVNSLKQG
jgi:uncharacterized protein YegJ (DUF2314 family)